MRNLPWLHLAIYLGAVFIAALSQVLLKKAAMRPHRSVVEEYLNPQVIFAYGLFF
ncbi:MAG: multidrug ABC transporter, partial [Stomatobaculum longum]|nr:multidrug ABC transporter [Stomatobaculum longum]